jgi:hypothetical protein
LNHGFHCERFQRSRRATFYRFAPITNTFPVFVDLLTLNLHNANHDFAKTVDLVHQSHNGLCMLDVQCNAFVADPINMIVRRLLRNGVICIELTFNAIKVGDNHRVALGHVMKVCACQWVHFLVQQQLNQ